MKTLPLSEVKMKLSALVESVRLSEEEIMITKNGSPAAILVSPDEFDGWRETLAIRNEPALLNEIQQGLAALDKERSALYTLGELFDN